MASSVNNSMNMRLLNSFFGRQTSRRTGFSGTIRFSSISWGLDSFSSTSGNQVIKKTVEKLQAIINRQPVLPQRQGAGQNTINASTGLSFGGTTQLLGNTLMQPIAPPTQEEIDSAVARAGGAEALQPWLVDGKTKLDINGRKVVADITGSAQSSTGEATEAKSEAELRQTAATSLARFGLSEQDLDRGVDRVKEKLREAAAGVAAQNPTLSLAVEYALEDAFAKVAAWDNAVNGAKTFDYDEQRRHNLDQAASIARQLGTEGQNWGVESLAEDLAVFGMDFTAMQGDPYELAEKVRSKSKEMLASLESRYVGTEAEFIARRNTITGASARLINGLEGSAGSMALASMDLQGTYASSKVSVSVGGASLDANFVISVGNVIVDPLVLDLNGDGIDLKGADEGVEFDMNGDGQTAATGFIQGDDALLFLDLHGDGLVRDGRQLFGNAGGHANGFDMLASYDENGDGVIDENDSVYDQLMVWQEKNENGVCEEGETMSLRDAGIRSINLGYQNVREDDGKGNLIGQTGSFTRDDGSSGLAVDAWFQERKA